MSEEMPAQRDDSFFDVFKKHDAVMLLVDPATGKILDANHAAEKFYGYSSAQFQGMNIADINQLPSAQTVEELQHELHRENNFFVFPHKLASGEIRIVESRSSPIVINGNTVLFSIIQDVSERRQVENKLRSSELKFRTLAENIPSVIYQCLNDDNFTLIYINNAIVDLTGYPPEAFLDGSISFFELYHPEDLPIITAPFSDRFHITYRLRHKSGEWRWVDEWGTSTLDSMGEVRYIEGVMVDITELKQMENALRSSEERYRSLFDQMMDGIYRSTHEGKFVDVNPTMVKMFGYSSREEMLNIDIKHELYFAPEERGSHVLDTGQEEIEVYRMRRKDGTEIWVEDHGYYIHDDQGNVIYHEGMLRDITERKQAEDTLRQRLQELESLFKISASLRTIQTFEEVLPILLDQTLLALGTETGSILLYDPEQDELRAVYSRGWFNHIKDIPVKAGVGVAGKVFTTGQPWFSTEFINENLPEHLAHTKIPSGWGGACLPLHAGSEILGVLFAAVKLPNQITSEQMKLLNSLSEIAGATLHRTRLYDETARRAREFSSLYETSNALSAQTELNTMLQFIVEAGKKLLNSASAGMYFYIPASSELELTMHTEKYLTLGTRLKIGEGGAGRVAQTRRPLRLDNYSKWEGRSPQYEHASFIRAVLEVPMLYGGELIGVLTVDEVGDSERKFTEADERLLSLFASQAAGAIHSTRLRQEALNRLEHLQTLRTVDKAIASNLDLRITLDILLTHVIAQLGVDAADVLLLHPQEQTLQYSAGQGFRTHMIENAAVHLNDDYAGRCVIERKMIQVSDLDLIIPNQNFYRLWSEEKFVSYICIPLLVKGEVKGVLEAYSRSQFVMNDEWYEFLETLAGQAAITIDNTQLFDSVQRANMELAIAYEATIEGWSRALDLRDKETEGHTQRVTELTMALAKTAGIFDTELQYIRRGALLHDIGKMGISDRILLKKGKLTSKEWQIMRNHPNLALKMLQPILYLRQSLDIPYCHHEKWDGTGYPRGLKGDAIPLAARLFAIADVWDALTSSRSYRKAWTKKKALEYIKEQSGIHFDPYVVEIFLRTIKDFLTVKYDH